MNDKLETCISLGLVFGVAIGSIRNNIPIGVGLGILFGAIVGTFMTKDDKKKNKD